MSKFNLKLICLALALTVLALSDSAFAAFCDCLGFESGQQACCGEKQIPCHQGKMGTDIKIMDNNSCDCSISWLPSFIFQKDANENLTLDEVAPQVSTWHQEWLGVRTEMPVWLRHVFYPDKSRLYLDSRHLLL